MDVGAAGDHGDPGRSDLRVEQPFGDDLGAAQGSMLAFGELRLGRQLESDRLGGDHVLEWPTLLAWEDRGVDLLRDSGVVAQDHPAPRTAQRLVGRGGDDVRMRHRIGMQAGGHQAREVGHVDQEVGIDQVSDPAKLGEVQLACVGRPARDDHLGSVLERESFNLGHIDEQVLLAHLVRDHPVEAAREVDPHPVGQMATVRQRETENGVAGFEHSEHRRCVGLCAGVGLNIGELGAEQRLDPIDGELFDYVDVLTASVVAASRVALGVLVRQDRTLGVHDRDGREVLRGDHLQRVLLAGQLRGDRGLYLGIGVRQ